MAMANSVATMEPIRIVLPASSTVESKPIPRAGEMPC